MAYQPKSLDVLGDNPAAMRERSRQVLGNRIGLIITPKVLAFETIEQQADAMLQDMLDSNFDLAERVVLKPVGGYELEIPGSGRGHKAESERFAWQLGQAIRRHPDTVPVAELADYQTLATKNPKQLSTVVAGVAANAEDARTSMIAVAAHGQLDFSGQSLDTTYGLVAVPVAGPDGNVLHAWHPVAGRDWTETGDTAKA